MEKIVNKVEMSLNDKRKALAESGIFIGAVILLCYFFGFSYIWNTDVGSEAGVNGWNYMIACLTWNFKSTSPFYGDLAIPFNYYAKYYVRVLAVATTVTFPILVAYIVLSCLNIRKYKPRLEKIITIVLYALTVAFLACFIIALTMNGSKILPKYCSNNPKCSIASLAIFPFLVSLGASIAHTVFAYKTKEAVE